MASENPKSSRTRNLILAAAVSLIAVFLLGFVPQLRKASRLQNQLQEREQRIGQLEREARLSKARDLASVLHLELTRKNYGTAAQHATAFFSHVRTMLNDAPDASLKSTLENIVGHRDSIVANIAKADPAVETQVRDILERVHQLTAR